LPGESDQHLFVFAGLLGELLHIVAEARSA
jgi:hypothetical protein